MDSLAMGHYFLPVLQDMVASLPKVRCAVLCTPDGFNIASIGLDEQQVGKMAALSSSLMAVGASAIDGLPLGSTEGSGGLNVMTMEAGGIHVATVRIQRQQGGDLVLMVAAASPLGVVLHVLQSTRARIAGM